ncbi:hypothetical protein U370_04035 [Anaplasma marginale str. Dawn]|uniref:hypothetical protein n=1 Tax=Anaplasma marginale TaxID=770 RepID=UPI0003C27498|nr:hypothetical protein [Anaplasma marginale]AGZ79122.1 hypothetical protein U128_04180 [Anaplasma marginale str. Gypsy Plains]AGZ79924.1 hypothetical protein U370_04035 [Anaplasma marginale str. Dawn]AXW85254.1 hypothetical protein BKM88_04120 [Anaplasma marginale]KAA8472523.1 hypothetical protein F0Q58_02590 [Anaplasma marginale]KAB0450943.1 hypothetical protein FY210_01930 [Anaplasma marginale]
MYRDADYGDVGVSRIGRDRLYAKICAVLLVASAASLSFFAAYISASGVHLLGAGPATAAFLCSMVAAFVAFSGLMVFCLRLKSVDKYGLVVSLPEEAFSSSGMLQMNGSFVRSTNARAEVSVRTGGLRGAKFEPLSCALVGALGVSLCTFSAAFGVLCACAQGDFVEAAKALFVPSTASHVCLVAAALVLVTGGVGLIRYMLSSAGNGMLVLSDDRTHFSDADIDDIADRLNVSSANIANVRISKGGASVVPFGVSPLLP